jgi:hypothetical protein
VSSCCCPPGPRFIFSYNIHSLGYLSISQAWYLISCFFFHSPRLWTLCSVLTLERARRALCCSLCFLRDLTFLLFLPILLHHIYLHFCVVFPSIAGPTRLYLTWYCTVVAPLVDIDRILLCIYRHLSYLCHLHFTCSAASLCSGFSYSRHYSVSV